jgi:hypothetical protein
MLADGLINMTAGMIVGMAVCPIMMKTIKNIRQNIRVNRILREISETRYLSSVQILRMTPLMSIRRISLLII